MPMTSSLALPKGYDTAIGEQGLRLSGGQRQRIAIARAFLKDAPLLILDEATSHLDTASEALIGDAIQRLMTGRTTIIIAHRLALAGRAQQIALLEKGSLIQKGSHDELLAQNGRYRHFIHSFEGGQL